MLQNTFFSHDILFGNADIIFKHAPLLIPIDLLDAGGVQVSPHPEESSEGETGHDAALCS